MRLHYSKPRRFTPLLVATLALSLAFPFRIFGTPAVQLPAHVQSRLEALFRELSARNIVILDANQRALAATDVPTRLTSPFYVETRGNSNHPTRFRITTHDNRANQMASISIAAIDRDTSRTVSRRSLEIAYRTSSAAEVARLVEDTSRSMAQRISNLYANAGPALPGITSGVAQLLTSLFGIPSALASEDENTTVQLVCLLCCVAGLCIAIISIFVGIFAETAAQRNTAVAGITLGLAAIFLAAMTGFLDRHGLWTVEGEQESVPLR